MALCLSFQFRGGGSKQTFTTINSTANEQILLEPVLANLQHTSYNLQHKIVSSPVKFWGVSLIKTNAILAVHARACKTHKCIYILQALNICEMWCYATTCQLFLWIEPFWVILLDMISDIALHNDYTFFMFIIRKYTSYFTVLVFYNYIYSFSTNAALKTLPSAGWDRCHPPCNAKPAKYMFRFWLQLADSSTSLCVCESKLGKAFSILPTAEMRNRKAHSYCESIYRFDTRVCFRKQQHISYLVLQ